MQNKYIIASFLVFIVGFASMAQGSGTPPPPGPPPPPGLPIDDSIIVLFVIALVYGMYKTYRLASKQSS